jgi:hypothetical protein
LVELVDTSDLKSDSFQSIGSSPIMSNLNFCLNDGIGRHARFRF